MLKEILSQNSGLIEPQSTELDKLTFVAMVTHLPSRLSKTADDITIFSEKLASIFPRLEVLK